ncbi:MAG: glutaredoxin family protein [Planctomycetes bacterium]|jgi:thiol-disulfide isomerase/thioredoxin|nr:glutaredoxin family protein [Planctomycetota bacterium]MBT4028058.1 glutaredoxin family protein [Planctomycetota bacterium]MBT4560157.1 glutaredoxin family protein [Planctomycetota bacterium]MBT5101438.1 glutaredoxin family protein [Planctomycetota bacterium]MBT5120738.1 glutaredoxin family protein [Planctomycetota bacterium]
MVELSSEEGDSARPSSEPARVIFYTRPVCPLCDSAIRSLQTWVDAGDVMLEFVNIESDLALEKKWGCSIPVLEYAGRALAKGRFDAELAMARLKRWRNKEATL